MVLVLRYELPLDSHIITRKRQGRDPKVSTPLPLKEYKFLVMPRESLDEREARWDKWMQELASDGYVVQGTGPDGDYPIRYSFAHGDEEITFEEWWEGNPDAHFFEVYNIVPLPMDAQPTDPHLREVSAVA